MVLSLILILPPQSDYSFYFLSSGPTNFSIVFIRQGDTVNEYWKRSSLFYTMMFYDNSTLLFSFIQIIFSG